mmetsp:Transcript_4110/g.8710  ORF Transcript_4110/g.8710 Transcript_4110/m.8710 type:complete len:213 (+) Transcript_4110:177-815(+)
MWTHSFPGGEALCNETGGTKAIGREKYMPGYMPITTFVKVLSRNVRNIIPCRKIHGSCGPRERGLQIRTQLLRGLLQKFGLLSGCLRRHFDRCAGNLRSGDSRLRRRGPNQCAPFIQNENGTKMTLEEMLDFDEIFDEFEVQDYSFIRGYALEFVVSLFVYYPLVETVLFSGVLGCGRIPFLGGRPYAMKQEAQKRSDARSICPDICPSQHL